VPKSIKTSRTKANRRNQKPELEYVQQTAFDRFREEMRQALDTQFQRIAQIQAVLDETLATNQEIREASTRLHDETHVVRGKISDLAGRLRKEIDRDGLT
jgi:hypothetical protein